MKTWIRRLFAAAPAPTAAARFRPAVEGMEARDCPAAFTLAVRGDANIFGAGRVAPPQPGGHGAGVLPPVVRVGAAPGAVVTFPRVTGAVTCWEGVVAPTGPEDRTAGHTDIASHGGISGIVHGNRTMFLVGVFLTNTPPAGRAPGRLTFSDPENFTDLKPRIGQTFFIGNGRTENGHVQGFHAPAGATRLYLGFADADAFGEFAPLRPPGWYGDNAGALSVVAQVTRTAKIGPAVPMSGLDATGGSALPPPPASTIDRPGAPADHGWLLGAVTLAS